MARERTDMYRLQELVRLCRMGVGVRERCRLLKMSSRTERRYREALEGRGFLEGASSELPELQALKAVVVQAIPEAPPRSSVASRVEPWREAITEAFERGVGPKAIWDRLRREDPEFSASVGAVKRFYGRLKKARGVRAEDVAIPVVTVAGDVAQVDFGYVGKLFDEETGRIRKAWAFVVVLGYSRHMYARVVFDQGAQTWLELHIEAFRWFGGVPRTLVPDNLKAAVIRAAFGAGDRHDLALNRSYRELARYYAFKVDPTPVRAPKKKGKVESAVKYLKRNFIAAGGFETLAQVEAALPGWLRRTAGERVHGSTGRRPLEVFEAEERSALLPLPAVSYEPVLWKKATVHPDSHVELDGLLYSVPWRFIGRKVWLRRSPHTVDVFFEDARIAIHERLAPGRGRYRTQEQHLPEHRRDLRWRCEDYWLERADRLGADAGRYVRAVLDSDDVLSKLRDVQAIVTYLEPFPAHRVAAACRRALHFDALSYAAIKRILVRALDREPLPAAPALPLQPQEQHRFARSVDELLAHLKEPFHEPN